MIKLKMEKTFIKIILSFLFIWFFMNIYMYFYQDSVLYKPEKTIIHFYPTQPNHNFNKIKIQSDYSLSGWFHFKGNKF